MGANREVPSQAAYWDGVASRKRFSHPLRWDWLRKHLETGARILDHGCGYGRVLEQVSGAGYRNIVGADFSRNMLTECRARLPLSSVVLTDGQSLPFQDRSFDAVLLFAVLTCIPDNADQSTLLSEVQRVLRPGGILYISDLLLNSDSRNTARYQRYAEEFGTYGVFSLPEGVVVRHHSEEWIEQLTAALTRVESGRFTVTTMNGNRSAAFQYLGRLDE